MKYTALTVAAIWMIGTHAAAAADPDLTKAMNAVRDRMAMCWNIPAGVADPVAVSVHVVLNPDGSLHGKPNLVKAAEGTRGKVVAESAIRAVEKCAPYPEAAKAGADEFTVNFDPSEMF